MTAAATPTPHPVAPPAAGLLAGAAPVLRLSGSQPPAANLADQQIHQAAAAGVRTPAQALPFAAPIQRAFGRHQLGPIQAHVGPDATASALGMQARAFATGQHVVFAGTPDLHTAAHEATHVVQQRAGVHLAGGVGRVGDPYERQANAVADRVVAGQSAEDLLGPVNGAAPVGVTTPPVQRQILLVDREQHHYDEVEAGKPAHGHGPFYYTGIPSVGGKPLFVPAAPVDEFTNAKGREDDDVSSTAYHQALAGVQRGPGKEAFEATYANWKFYTDDGDVTATLNPLTKENAAQQSLHMPLLRDPLRQGNGFNNRFPAPKGAWLVSKLSKEATLAKLGALPDGVKLFPNATPELYNMARKAAVYPEDITAEFAYFRAGKSPELAPRDPSSKFKTKTTVNTGDEQAALAALKNVKADEVPPAQANTDVTVVYKGYARKKSRGKGQEHAMNGWNALAYAGYCNEVKGFKVSLQQDWEWLHIQGSQNGGPTTAANLVAGTSTTNSRMIPWEDKINTWTNSAKPNNPLKVRYQGKRFSGTNLGSEIKFSISAPAGLPGVFDAAIPDADPVVVVFDPTRGDVFDRVSRRLAMKASIGARVKETDPASGADEEES